VADQLSGAREMTAVLLVQETAGADKVVAFFASASFRSGGILQGRRLA
jgi:hypothetical protein